MSLFLAALALASQAGQPAPTISLATNPVRVCADESSSRAPNFDIIIRNKSARPLTIAEIRARSFDSDGTLLEQRIIWQQALSLLGDQRTVSPGQEGIVYQPFQFATANPGTRLEYEIQFEGLPSPATLSVHPISCVTKARLTLPLSGRILIYDGYDFQSHHRRKDDHMREDFKAFGFVDNPFRFGIDLVPIDADGRMFRGDGSRIEDWYGWEMPVRAAGDGIVAAVRDDMPDNALGSEDYPKRPLSEDEMNWDGNYVLIDHGNGEFSSATHLRQGSARVKKGQRVKAGQVIAQIGNSGATPVPHLHYELRTGFGVRGVRGLPPYFHEVEVIGQPGASEPVALNTGDVVIAR